MRAVPQGDGSLIHGDEAQYRALAQHLLLMVERGLTITPSQATSQAGASGR